MCRAVVVAGALALVATGCSGGHPAAARPVVCTQALDAADAGFTAIGTNVQRVQVSLDEAFAGDMVAAQRDLATVQHIDSTTYKRLEARCRAAVNR